MDKLKSAWDTTLITLSGGASVTFGQAVLVGLFVIAGLLLTHHLARLLMRLLRRNHVDPNAAQTIQRLFYWVLLITVFVTALAMLQIPISALTFVGGALAVGVGFGAQNIVGNLISSWILMSEKPVRIGDFIEIDQYTGTVERIGNRSTRIRRADGVHILVPNSQMLERVVVNWTLLDHRFRSSVRVGVAYGSPVRRVAELILAATRAQTDVLADPEPMVVFEDFGDSTLVFESFFWCDANSGNELRMIRSDIRFNIEATLRENGIAIAFPQRDVHLSSSQPIPVRLVGAGDVHPAEKAPPAQAGAAER